MNEEDIELAAELRTLVAAIVGSVEYIGAPSKGADGGEKK